MRLSGRPAVAVAALEPDGRVLLVTNFASQQLETVNVTNLP